MYERFNMTGLIIGQHLVQIILIKKQPKTFEL